jgi:RNA polymerase sigma-70 factor (ECF subfamily)
MNDASSLGRAALEDLARHAVPSLRRLAARITGRTEAEDVVQDAYLLLLVAGTKVRHPRRFLEVATSSHAIDRYRRARVRARGLDELVEMERVRDETPDPEKAAGATQLVQRLTAALAELPHRVRRAILLSRVHGVSHLAISRQLGVSPKTVERDILRALSHCTTRLSRDGVPG